MLRGRQKELLNDNLWNSRCKQPCLGAWADVFQTPTPVSLWCGVLQGTHEFSGAWSSPFLKNLPDFQNVKCTKGRGACAKVRRHPRNSVQPCHCLLQGEHLKQVDNSVVKEVPKAAGSQVFCDCDDNTALLPLETVFTTPWGEGLSGLVLSSKEAPFLWLFSGVDAWLLGQVQGSQ